VLGNLLRSRRSHPWRPSGISPDEDGDRFIEIWNLVFMQFEQAAARSSANCPSQHRHRHGAGTDRRRHAGRTTTTIPTRSALIAASEGLTGVKAERRPPGQPPRDRRSPALDQLPAGRRRAARNEGRGYVLRRIMRRAMRHAHLLGAKEPLMHRWCRRWSPKWAQAYPELGRAQPLIEETLQREEVQFRRTLANGLKLLDEATGGLGEGGDSCPAKPRSSSMTPTASPMT
jgi:alanyl-tRNA synthetase